MKKALKIILIVLASILVLGIIGAMFSDKGKDKETSVTTSSVASQEEVKSEVVVPISETSSSSNIETNKLSPSKPSIKEETPSSKKEVVKISSSKPSIKEETPSSEKEVVKISVEQRYQSILDTYTKKIKEATPGLVNEYNQGAEKNTDGLNGLAKLSNSKVTKLAEISNNGVSEMAEIMTKYGSGKYSEYEEWAGKLMDVYMSESEQIMDAYMDSAQ